MDLHAPWLKFYDGVPEHIEYPDCTMVEMVYETAKKYPDLAAYDFMGTKSSFKDLIHDIEIFAKGLIELGVKPNDRITICLPNMPQAVIAIYAINLCGAVANMIHPLSAEGEIEFFLKEANSSFAITLDAFYPRFEAIRDKTPLKTVLIISLKNDLNPLKALAFSLTSGRKIKPVSKKSGDIFLKDFIHLGKVSKNNPKVKRSKNDIAAILYSGGTTGTTKGILLSNLNFNALAMQTAAMGNCISPKGKMLTVLPLFHGFGLAICMHTALINASTCLLIPRFTPQSFAELIIKKRPNYIAGVPTLYESMLKNQKMKNADLSCLKGVFVGGDSLSTDLKHRFDAFLKEHGCETILREGYGTTECVTASCLTPLTAYREGSIGIPFSDTFYKIVKPETTQELPYGEIGEICINGPSVMIGYLNNEEETKNTLKPHEDGYIWLHTGDLGYMDEDGFIYFKQRLKRMIVSSGYSIYPSHIEKIIDSHEKVSMSCVIGVPDPYKIQKVKAFVVLLPGVLPSNAVKEEIFSYCRQNIAKYSLPYDIEFREVLPQTKVGKIAYTMLEKEEQLAKK